MNRLSIMLNEWQRLAVRNVWRNRRRSLMLGCTIAIGGLAMLLFMGYIAASLAGLRESTIRSGLGHLHVAHAGGFDSYSDKQLQFGLNLAEQTQIRAVLDKDDRVRRTVARLDFQGLVSNGPRTIAFQGKGVDAAAERAAFSAFSNIDTGEGLRAGDEHRYEALIGKEMARRLGVTVGDSISLMTTTISGGINAIDLQVVGIVSTGIPQSELYFLRVPLSTAQEVMRTSSISYFSVLLRDTDLTAAVQSELSHKLDEKLFEVRNWRVLEPLYDQVLTMYRNQFIVFGTIIAIVVFLSVATMTLTTIFERSREIGTLRALGISAAQVRRIFMWEGLFQGVLGSMAAGVLGYGGSLLINTLNIMQPPPPGRDRGYPLRLLWQVDHSLLLLVILCATAALAALWVSRRISKLPVVIALNPQ